MSNTVLCCVFRTLKAMLDAMRLLFDRIPDEYRLLMEPRLDELSEAIEPGITTLNWLSVDIPDFVKSVYKVIDKLQLLIDRCAFNSSRQIQVYNTRTHLLLHSLALL